ncbi:CG42828 [Drosophila busckii]|uniref:CG42828 n=1 Tax=Drosophila busckii TaxID=30019 RepID=A0A0M4EFH8_DROBS|nr:CG42828 [Drosophila busckii]
MLRLTLMLLLASWAYAQFYPPILQDPQSNRQAILDKIAYTICNSRSSYGNCKGHRQLWYFNTRRGYCQRFTYSNCGGNRNRFYTKDDCNEFCAERFKVWRNLPPV